MQRKSHATWNGDLKAGKGTMKLGSGAYEGQYNFTSRFESGKGTNPEELIAAAHAGCFSMALANSLSKAGHKVTSIETTAAVELTKGDGGSSITGIHLTTRGVVAGVSEADFQKAAEETKKGCIVSRALSAVPMTLDAELATAKVG